MCELKGSRRSSLLGDSGLGDLPVKPVSQAWSPMASLWKLSASSHPPGTHCTTNFDGEILGHHAVAGRQVPVHKLLGSKVGHAICNLPSHLNHVTEGRLWEARVVLQAREGLVKDCPAPTLCQRFSPPQPHTAQGLSHSDLCLRPQRSEMALEIPTGH